jgi:hypothetical protein
MTVSLILALVGSHIFVILMLSKSGMKRIPGALTAISIITILIALSCTEGSCFEETESYVKATFYKGTVATAPDNITLFGMNKDSLIYDKATGVKVAKFPLNSVTESSRFIILINGISDTIVFRYNSYPHLISKECGYTFYHHLDTVPGFTKNNIDNITLSSPTVTNLNVENIRIYY